VPGSEDGTGSAARFFEPTGVALDASGNLYVADEGNDLIRKEARNGFAADPGAADGPVRVRRGSATFS